MKHGTNIPWTHVPGYRGEVFNPVVGCTPAPGSEKGGCRNCWARVLHEKRRRSNGKVARGLDSAQRLGPVSGWATTLEASRELEPLKLPWPPQYDLPFARVRCLSERLEKPLHWKAPRAIFVDSVSDLFHSDVPDEFIDRVFAVMALTPQHVYFVLTKRPERMREYLTKARPPNWTYEGGPWPEALDRITGAYLDMATRGFVPARVLNTASDWQHAANPDNEGLMPPWPFPNVWLGVSVEDQATADARVPWLLDTPAAIHFLSMEPLLGSVDLRRFIPFGEPCEHRDHGEVYHGHCSRCGLAEDMQENDDALAWADLDHECPSAFGPSLDWVIVGGESGPGWRPMDQAWVISLRKQCRDADVPYFGKQLAGARSGLPLPWPLGDREWPEVT